MFAKNSPIVATQTPTRSTPWPNPHPNFPPWSPRVPDSPPSRRTGARSAGDPQRRRERMERAQPGAGSPRGRWPRGCEVEPGERPDGRGGGAETRTGPGDGRCHPCPPCAEGPLVNSEAHGPGMWKPVRAERLTFAETHTPTVSGRPPGAPPTPLTARETRAANGGCSVRVWVPSPATDGRREGPCAG